MNKLKIFKFIGFGFSVVGMAITAIVGNKENKLYLEALVNNRLDNK